MLLSGRTARRAVAGAIGAGAFASAMFTASPMAFADPPPNCTAGDLAGVASGVSASTSAYLFTHEQRFADQATRQLEQARSQEKNGMITSPAPLTHTTPALTLAHPAPQEHLMSKITRRAALKTAAATFAADSAACMSPVSRVPAITRCWLPPGPRKRAR